MKKKGIRCSWWLLVRITTTRLRTTSTTNIWTEWIRFVCREMKLEREMNIPCIIVLYKLSSFLCSQIVATTEYFESTRGYCCLKHALVFLGFKSTKNMNMFQIFDRKCFIDSLATIFSARCKPIYIDRSCTLHWGGLPYILYRWLSTRKMVLYYQKMVF